MGEMSNIELRRLCYSLEVYPEVNLVKIIRNAEYEYLDNLPIPILFNKPPDFLWICADYLKENYTTVSKIIKGHYSSLADMVYDLALVVGPQLMENGKIKTMTIVVTLLLVLGKRGFYKVLSDSKDSPDNTSDEGKGDTK